MSLSSTMPDPIDFPALQMHIIYWFLFLHTLWHTHPLTADPTDITDFYIYANLRFDQTEACQGDALCELPLLFKDRASL